MNNKIVLRKRHTDLSVSCPSHVLPGRVPQLGGGGVYPSDGWEIPQCVNWVTHFPEGT